jgi:Glutaredoxin-like domain (DUF836)
VVRGQIPTPRVVLYKAEGCHLCERARAKLLELRDELGFELAEILIDGERVCTYYVQPEPFRRKLAAAQTAAKTPGL